MPALPLSAERPPVVEPPAAPTFAVRLDGFEGPFDLLLHLLAKHQLDLTEVALSKVTDDFLAHLRARGPEWDRRDLGQASEFLVVAATLLDLKTARLLPSADVEDEEDLALLEAPRDLLFARLLQYRAYKAVAGELAARMDREGDAHPRSVALEPRFAQLLPEVLLGVGADELAALAARALAPRPGPAEPAVPVAHVHAPRVSVREQALLLRERLRQVGTASFRALSADCPDTLTVVARFLALLELYREGVLGFEQQDPLGDLLVRWTAPPDPALADEDAA